MLSPISVALPCVALKTAWMLCPLASLEIYRETRYTKYAFDHLHSYFSNVLLCIRERSLQETSSLAQGVG